MRAAHRETQHGLIRCGRTVTAVLLVIILARVWGLDLRDLASQGVGAQLAGALVEVFLIGIVAYGCWELLEIMANRQIAIERAALGLDDESEEQLEGEGGQGGTRLGTVMPLVRRTGQVLIAALALLAVLGQVGVNVTPLLAGAGIVGVAIGFGAPGPGQGHHLRRVLPDRRRLPTGASTSTSAPSRGRSRKSRSAPCNCAITTGR